MPERQQPMDLAKAMNDVLRRLGDVERKHFPIEEVIQQAIATSAARSYTWQSAKILLVGVGLRFYAEQDGVIQFVRAERDAGDGTSTATLDLLVNGTSIFTSVAKPTVAAGAFLGEEVIPDEPAFAKGDYFECEIEVTGGGTGPLRLTFVAE